MATPPSIRFRATVHFEGSNFHGWQVQPHHRTVQGEIETRLTRLFGHPTRVDAAGRTDTGVHATAQEIAFNATHRWTAGELRGALNALLPNDVWVEAVNPAPPTFHPRFDASARRYEYVLGVLPDSASPIWSKRLWAIARPLDERTLVECASVLIGEHDFRALAKSGQPERGTRCRVERADWTRDPDAHLRFTMVADRFLHHMVRYVVGTLVEVTLGRRSAHEVELLVAGASGVRPPVPAPACGLYLTGVRFGSEWNRPDRVLGKRLQPEYSSHLEA